MAEWSKALDLGSSHFDGVGSNPTAATPSGVSLFHPSTSISSPNYSSLFLPSDVFFFSPTVENPQRDPSFHSLSPYTGISTCKSYFFQFSLFFFFNGMGKGREKKETAGQSTSLPSLLHKPTNPATLKNGNKNVSLFPWESILRYLEKLSTVCLRL